MQAVQSHSWLSCLDGKNADTGRSQAHVPHLHTGSFHRQLPAVQSSSASDKVCQLLLGHVQSQGAGKKEPGVAVGHDEQLGKAALPYLQHCVGQWEAERKGRAEQVRKMGWFMSRSQKLVGPRLRGDMAALPADAKGDVGS